MVVDLVAELLGTVSYTPKIPDEDISAIRSNKSTPGTRFCNDHMLFGRARFWQIIRIDLKGRVRPIREDNSEKYSREFVRRGIIVLSQCPN